MRKLLFLFQYPLAVIGFAVAIGLLIWLAGFLPAPTRAWWQ